MGILYEHIKEDIERRINENEFRKGEFIPNELSLQNHYGVSRTTVRKAISMLIEEGVLVIARGKGTLVAPSKLKHKISSLKSFTQLIQEQGFEPSISSIRVQKIKAPQNVTLKLELEENEEVFRIYRIRTIDKMPMTINESFIPCRLIPDFSEDRMRSEQSLYKILEDEFGIGIHATEDEITAVRAGNENAELLEITKNDPVLCINRVAYDKNNIPVEFCNIIIRSDRYKHIITLIR